MNQKFYITSFNKLDSLINSRIKSKKQIIEILLISLKSILLNINFPSENKGSFYIETEGTFNRIFFTCLDEEGKVHKHFSFLFPFNIELDEDSNCILKLNKVDTNINMQIIDVLSALSSENWFSDFNERSHDLLTFTESYAEITHDFLLAPNLDTDLWTIIKVLLTFEPGYIRYDYDLKNCEENSHPLHHLDINYSDQGTFKLGFNQEFSVEERLLLEGFNDILKNGKNRNNRCYRIL